MVTATIGGLIKDYRIKKRLSQLELSLGLGWKDSTRLSKIEQGRVAKPTRDNIEKILKALQLDETEKGNFLMSGGYLPTEVEIQSVINEIGDKINTWKYPAYMTDFTFRWLYTNDHTLHAVNMLPEQKEWVIANKPNFLEFPFLPKDQLTVEIMKGEDEKNLKNFQIAQIAAFKTENEKFQQESWYKKLVMGLMKYEDFRKLWPIVDQSMYHKKLFDYEYKRISGLYNGKKEIINLHLSTAKFINDPRFQIILSFPADKSTDIFFNTLK